MIILKIILWIILALLGIILLVLIMPASVSGSYIGGKVEYSVKFAFLPVYNSKGSGIVNKLLEWKKKKADSKEDEDSDEEKPTLEDSPVETEETAAETTAAEATANAVEEVTETVEEAPEEEPEAEDETPEAVEAEEVTVESEQPLKPEKSEKPESLEKPSNDEPDKPSKLEFFIDLWEAADRPVLKIFKSIKISELYIDFFIANEDAYKCALNYGKISGALYNTLAWMSILFNVKLKTIDINPLFGQKKSQWDISLKISLCLMSMLIAGLQFLLIYLFRVLIPKKIQLRKARK